MKLSSVLALACLALPLGTASAQSNTVTAQGFTIGDQGLKYATITEGGVHPSIIALESIQNGDVQIVPGNPKSPIVHLEASSIGSGSADYGTLGGSVTTQVRNQAKFNNFYTPQAEGILKMSFLDSGVVTSKTLVVGAPVTLNFVSSLASDFFTSGDRTTGKNGAGIEFEGFAQDQTTQLKGGGVILNGVSGATPPTLLFTLNTAVGRTVTLSGLLTVAAGSYIDGLPDAAGGDVLATSSALAAHTAHFYFQPNADLSLVTASGHDYSVPTVPETATTVSFGLLLMLGVGGIVVSGRRRKRISEKVD